MSKTNREAAPDGNERAARLGDLIAAPFLPLADVALYLDLPVSTIEKMRAQGTGPRLFKLGRRLYATKPDLHAWIEQMAKVSADN